MRIKLSNIPQWSKKQQVKKIDENLNLLQQGKEEDTEIFIRNNTRQRNRLNMVSEMLEGHLQKIAVRDRTDKNRQDTRQRWSRRGAYCKSDGDQPRETIPVDAGGRHTIGMRRKNPTGDDERNPGVCQLGTQRDRTHHTSSRRGSLLYTPESY